MEYTQRDAKEKCIIKNFAKLAKYLAALLGDKFLPQRFAMEYAQSNAKEKCIIKNFAKLCVKLGCFSLR